MLKKETKNKLGCWSTFIIMILIIWGLIVFFKSCKSKADIYVPEKKTEIVHNSEWDGSVSQVKDYLKANLNDWDSYEGIEWSPVKKMSGSLYTYMVRHKYRATNGFGAKIIVNQVFYLDYDGSVKDVVDYK
jgi:hypothetical protein